MNWILFRCKWSDGKDRKKLCGFIENDEKMKKKKNRSSALKQDSLGEGISKFNFFCDIIYSMILTNKCAHFTIIFFSFHTSITRLEYECVCNFIKIALKRSITHTNSHTLEKRFRHFFVLKWMLKLFMSNENRRDHRRKNGASCRKNERKFI